VLLPDVYKAAKVFKYSDHEVDAVFIALYGACYVAKIKPFNFEDMERFVEAVLSKLEKLRSIKKSVGGAQLQQ
jgi:hypothetical protein